MCNGVALNWRSFENTVHCKMHTFWTQSLQCVGFLKSHERKSFRTYLICISRYKFNKDISICASSKNKFCSSILKKSFAKEYCGQASWAAIIVFLKVCMHCRSTIWGFDTDLYCISFILIQGFGREVYYNGLHKV